MYIKQLKLKFGPRTSHVMEYIINLILIKNIAVEQLQTRHTVCQ